MSPSPDTDEILLAPDRERVATTNAWAFLHWLSREHGIDLVDWPALQAFSTMRPGDFQAAIIAYSHLPPKPLRLTRHNGPAEALVFHRANAARVSLTRDDFRQPALSLPAEIAVPLTRSWPPASLVRPLSDTLLHADLRPDDRVLVAGTSPWPWLSALLEGTAIILAAPSAADVLATTDSERASVLIAPAAMIAEAAFRRPGPRANLVSLRTIVAIGGPLSPEGRRRVVTWIRPDLLLLARSGDTIWGNPLEPVRAHPPATPALFSQSPPDPRRR